MSQSQSQEVPLDELVDGLASIKRMAFKVGVLLCLVVGDDFELTQRRPQ